MIKNNLKYIEIRNPNHREIHILSGNTIQPKNLPVILVLSDISKWWYENTSLWRIEALEGSFTHLSNASNLASLHCIIKYEHFKIPFDRLPREILEKYRSRGGECTYCKWIHLGVLTKPLSGFSSGFVCAISATQIWTRWNRREIIVSDICQRIFSIDFDPSPRGKNGGENPSKRYNSTLKMHSFEISVFFDADVYHVCDNQCFADIYREWKWLFVHLHFEWQSLFYLILIIKFMND